MSIIKKIRYSLHKIFSQKCSRMIVKHSKDMKQWEKIYMTLSTIKQVKHLSIKPTVSKWFKFCSYFEFKLRAKSK